MTVDLHCYALFPVDAFYPPKEMMGNGLDGIEFHHPCNVAEAERVSCAVGRGSDCCNTKGPDSSCPLDVSKAPESLLVTGDPALSRCRAD